MRHQRKFLWFLFGLGSRLQLFGTSLCFTELFVYGAAVCLFANEWGHMRKNGILPFFWVTIALLVNGFLSGVMNHTPFFGMFRGMAVLCLLPCAIVVCHWMLRNDMASFKWSVVGGGVSLFLSTFMFHNASLTAGVEGAAATEQVMGGPLWLVGQVGTLALLFPKGWYLQCPLLFSVVSPVALAGFALFTSASGRGTAVRAMCSAALVLLGGKNPTVIRRRVCRRFLFVSFVGVVVVLGFKNFYQYAASSGFLGEAARAKYENQTKGNKGMMALLLGGRMESFCGLMAAVDHPIRGFGPWAMDYGGYTGQFLAKYGQPEDFEAHERSRNAGGGAIGMIPCHAHLTEFWVWYGGMGLVFWLYVIFLLLRYLKQDCYVVPQYYFWLAAGVPSRLWDIFFNPFSDRVGWIMFIIACLLVRAVRQGRQQLPVVMVREIMKVERS